jgi:biopolymer transport protein ExbD
MAIRLSLEEDRVEETHEINVTPFIDVILVLLIIFMVAAPLSTVDVNVDLPAPAQAKLLSAATHSLARSTRRREQTRSSASSFAPTAPSPMARSWNS